MGPTSPPTGSHWPMSGLAGSVWLVQLRWAWELWVWGSDTYSAPPYLCWALPQLMKSFIRRLGSVGLKKAKCLHFIVSPSSTPVVPLFISGLFLFWSVTFLWIMVSPALFCFSVLFVWETHYFMAFLVHFLGHRFLVLHRNKPQEE